MKMQLVAKNTYCCGESTKDEHNDTSVMVHKGFKIPDLKYNHQKMIMETKDSYVLFQDRCDVHKHTTIFNIHNSYINALLSEWFVSFHITLVIQKNIHLGIL